MAVTPDTYLQNPSARRRRRRRPTPTASPDTYLQNTRSTAAPYTPTRTATTSTPDTYLRTPSRMARPYVSGARPPTPSTTATHPYKATSLRNGVPQPEGPDRKTRQRRRLRRVVNRVGDLAEQEIGGAEQTAEQIARAAIRASQQTGVPASLLIGLTGQESAYGTNTGPSSAGARGEAQFIESTRQSMIDKYGVDPWAGPDQAMQAAALYLKELGVLENPSQALSSYSGGYAEEDYNNPILQRAQQFAQTGVDRLAGSNVKVPRVPNGPRPGPWAGSQRIVRELLGPYARTEDWKDKEDRGGTGASLHDIGSPNAFAADLSPSEDIVDQITRRLARYNPGLDPDEVNYGTTGLESGLTYKGYDIEFLPYTHGSGPHVHIGAEWTGDALPPGTVSGGPLAPADSSVGDSGFQGSQAATAGIEQLLGSRGPQPTQRQRRQTAGASTQARSELAARPVLPGQMEDNPLAMLLGEDQEEVMFRPQRRRRRRG